MLSGLAQKIASRNVPTTWMALGGLSILGGLSWKSFLDTSKVAFADGKVPPFSMKEFQEYELENVETVNYNCKLFRFKLHQPDTQLESRPYTPMSGDDKGHFELLIKEYPTGKVSKHVHSLHPGDKLKVKGPFKKMEYKPNMKKRIGMIAGGTGFSPMYQIITKILSNPDDKTQIDFVFANNTEDDMIYKAQLDALQAKHSNLRVHHLLAFPKSKSYSGPTGFVTQDIISQYIPKPDADTLVYVCGPPPMMDLVCGNKKTVSEQGPVTGLMAEMGYTPDHVYKL